MGHLQVTGREIHLTLVAGGAGKSRVDIGGIENWGQWCNPHIKLISPGSLQALRVRFILESSTASNMGVF